MAAARASSRDGTIEVIGRDYGASCGNELTDQEPQCRDLDPQGELGAVLAGEVLVLHLPRVVERVEGRMSDEERQGP